MAIKYIGRKMRAGTLALMIAGALGLSAAVVPSAQGQIAQRELPPPPPPALPSVSEYSLPPGDTQTPASNTAQGPVEENGTPPRTAPKPDDTQSNSQQVIVAPTPRTGTSPATGNQSQPTPVNNARPSATANPAPRTTPAPPPSSSSASAPATEAQGEASSDTNQPGPDAVIGLPVASDQPVSDAGPEAVPSAAAPQEAADTNSIYYFGGGIALLLLAGVGLYFWRRKTSAALAEDEAMDAPVPAPTPTPQKPAPRKPAPRIYSPPNPAEPKKPSPVSNDGFVISRIGAIPARQSAPATIPLPTTPQSPLAPQSKANLADTNLQDHLRIEFIANGASSTLLNAVLNYTVTLTNISDQALRDIRLSGAMMQADTQNARNTAAQSGNILHITESLPAGETVTLTGDIRLPLSSIRPIAFKSQALFIPLAHFGTEYLDEKGTAHQQNSSFIIGREYEPPRAKMAPFRLDLGPRSFGPVGQRPLFTS